MATTNINCSACGSEKSMASTKIHKFNFITRLIGYIIITPSMFGVLFALILFLQQAQLIQKL